MIEHYEAIIGLEVHVELATKSKMFCGCPADYFGQEPNTQTCPVCLGLPGALPVPNRKAVDWTMLLGLALGCEINTESKFDRKNYFYPDLAKGYQISQYDQPIAVNGQLVITKIPARGWETKQSMTKIGADKLRDPSTALGMTDKKVRIRRVHIEEDTGKLIHETVNEERVGLVDFNRSGVPLVEIVTEPDFRSIDEVDQYVRKIQQIVRYLGISGADMEKGSMRIEPSVSLRTQNLEQRTQQSGSRPGQKLRILAGSNNKLPPYRVEIKNINSFRFARRALEYEIKRQSELLDNGRQPIQETRGWSEEKNSTIGQRDKEEASDYRYFPEPDIPPMRFSAAEISNLSIQIPKLPDEMLKDFINRYGLSEYDAGQLTESREKAEYFEKCLTGQKSRLRQGYGGQADVASENVTSKMVANWIINKKIDIEKIAPEELIKQIAAASQVSAVGDEQLNLAITKVISDNVKAVTDYKAGKEQALMFLLGQCIRALQGAGDKGKIVELLKSKLSNL